MEATCKNLEGKGTESGELHSSTANNLSLAVLMGLPASGKSTLAHKLSNFCSSWRTIIISYDDYVPLSVQAKVSEISANEKSDASTGRTSVAKMFRKKFIYCVETVVRFIQDMKMEKDKGIVVGDYLQTLNNFLCSIESPQNCMSNESFLSKVKGILNQLNNCIRASEEFNFTIIIDDNNYYHSMRNDFYQLAKQFEIGFCIMYCKTSLKMCVQRNSERPVELQVPHKVIVEMALKFNDPDPLLYACDMYCLQIDLNDNSEVNLVMLKNVLSISFSNHLKKNDDRTEEIERERRICSENEIHQADLILRKWVNKRLNLASISKSFENSNTTLDSNSAGSLKKTLSTELNAKKKKALEKLKSGEFMLSFRVEEDVEFQGEIIKLFEGLNIE